MPNEIDRWSETDERWRVLLENERYHLETEVGGEWLRMGPIPIVVGERLAALLAERRQEPEASRPASYESSMPVHNPEGGR